MYVSSNDIFKIKIIQSSRGGLEVERWSDKRLFSASVEQIPLEPDIFSKIGREYI